MIVDGQEDFALDVLERVRLRERALPPASL
jgi:hypothetical protein